MFAFPLSSLSSMPWLTQPLMTPIVNALAAVSTVEVNTSLELLLFVGSALWVAALFLAATFVAVNYTRNRFSNVFLVKVRRVAV